MSSPFDTIVAPITGSQPAAVAVIRVSGADAWQVAAHVFPAFPSKPEPLKAKYGRYVTGDDGLVLPFAKNHSYTGEQSVELSCHGSPASVRALVEACIQAGARHAEPGEFTQRAFLNGRMDLTEAEAVADTVKALTDAQLKIANRQREGGLHKEVAELRAEVLKVLAAVEASVDFEEEIGPLDTDSSIRLLERVKARLESLLHSSGLGKIIRIGLRVAIVGPPNAGKSSLFNAIVGHERAIVTPAPGTTRDYIEETVDIAGLPVVFIDTAGLRESTDVAESIGIQRSIAVAANADMTWFVYDVTDPDYSYKVIDFPTPCVIANKCDLLDSPRPPFGPEGQILVSARTGEGIDTLLRMFAGFAEQAAALQLPPPNERHAEQLKAAVVCVRDALSVLNEGLPTDLLATLLRGAANHLGQITGETASEDMIERIFADFCIGK